MFRMKPNDAKSTKPADAKSSKPDDKSKDKPVEKSTKPPEKAGPPKPADKPIAKAGPPKAAAPPAGPPMAPAGPPPNVPPDTPVEPPDALAGPPMTDAGPPMPDPMMGAPVPGDGLGRHELEKLNPMTVRYLGPENGPFACGNCCHFDGMGSCDVVSGPIDAAGICSVFETNTNPGPPEEIAPMDATMAPDAPVDPMVG